MDLQIRVFDHDKATELCRAVGGKLPEQISFYRLILLDQMNTDTFFLGMKKSNEDPEEWVWDSDGSLVIWWNWIEETRKYNCAELNKSIVPNYGFKWSSVQCSGHNMSRTTVCERTRK